MAKFLTFDLGTTLYKVALFDDSGRMIALQQAAPPVTHPQPDWWEVEPDAFKRVLVEAVAKLRFVAGDVWDDIVACSFATQANSFTLLDDNGRPIIPLILWPDRRAAGEFDAEMRESANLGVASGLPRLSVQLAVAKHRWLQQHEPQTLARARWFCFISDYLTRWLTGRSATEAAVAGLSGLAHILTLQWFDPVVQRFRIPTDTLAPIVRAGTELGQVLPEVADELGLPRSCRFVAGTLDQYAGAIGTGTILPDQVCETTGTVLAAVRCSIGMENPPSPQVFHGPSFEMPLFFQMSFSSTSANLLEWYRNTLSGQPSFEELSRLAADADDAVVIEPYRDGEPIESCFRHVRPEHTIGEVVRGIMKCVAEALKRQVSLLSPRMPDAIRCAGGAAKSDVWLQIKADTLGTTMEAVDCPEPTSLGAAMLAARAVTGRSLAELSREWVRVRAAFKPRK